MTLNNGNNGNSFGGSIRRQFSAGRWRMPATIAGIAVGLGLIVWWAVGRSSGGKQMGARPPVDVKIATVRPTTVPVVLDYLGQAEALQKVEIRSRVPAYVQKQGFREGRAVREGQTLFELERATYETDLESAKAQRQQASARQVQAEKQLERLQKMQANAVSDKELEEWQANERVAQADIKSADARIKMADLNLSYTTVKSPLNGVIGKALKDVGSYVSPSGESLLAVVQQIDPIYVQFSVSERDLLRWRQLETAAERGGSIPGQDKRAEGADDGDTPAMRPATQPAEVDPESDNPAMPMQIAAGGATSNPATTRAADGARASATAPSLRVAVRLADGSEYPFKGQMSFLDVSIDPETGTAQARATLPNPDGALRPGQLLRVKVEGLLRRGTITVPQSAVIQSPTGSSVYVVAESKDDAGNAVAHSAVRPVKLGEWAGDAWIVEEGLNPGDRVIADHLSAIAMSPPGAAVKVIGEVEASSVSTPPMHGPGER